MSSPAAVHKSIIPLIIAAAAAMFMTSLDGTIINIALPTISNFFNIPAATVAWVSTIYMLVTAGLFLVVGKISDILGYRKIFLLGLLIFTIGSIFSGFVPSITYCFPLLLVGRVIQALGGVIIVVVSLALVSANVPKEKLGKSLSIVMLFATIGLTLGPTLGGLLTEYLSWNWIFFVNVPIGITALILGYISLPKDKKGTSTMKGFDGTGSALIFIGLVSLLFLISEGAKLGWTSLPILISIGLAIFGLGGFILRERRAKSPILDFSLFKNKSFLVLSIIYPLMFFVFIGAHYLLPFYFQIIRQIPTFNTGLIMTIMSIGLMIAGLLGGLIYQKLIGKLKLLIMSGALLVVIGYLFLSLLNFGETLVPYMIGMACLGLGTGLNTTVLSTMMLGSVSQDKKGMVSGLVGVERLAPLALGIAVFNLLLVVSVEHLTGSERIIEMPLSSIAGEILTQGFEFCFLIGLLLSIIIFLICLFFKEKELNSEES